MIQPNIVSFGTAAADDSFLPAVPHTLAETGLTSSLMDDLLLKRLFNGGPQAAGDIADQLCLPFLLVLTNLNELRRLHITHVLGSQRAPANATTSIRLPMTGWTEHEPPSNATPMMAPRRFRWMTIFAQSVNSQYGTSPITRRSIEEAF